MIEHYIFYRYAFGDGLIGFTVFKGTVQRKLRWVKNGINRKLFLYCLAANIFIFYLKRLSFLKYIKPFQRLMITKISFV
jgi:hypothetical protein